MIIGVDPGASGAIACINILGELCWVEDMPMVDKNVSPVLVKDLFRSLMINGQATVGRAVVEKVSSMPGQGVSTTFKFGKNYGVVLGVLGALDISIVDVTPAVWKRDMGLGKDKEMSRALALKTWPKQADRFKRKMDEGRAEAALLALWGLRQLNGLKPVQEIQGNFITPGQAVESLKPLKGRVIRRRSI